MIRVLDLPRIAWTVARHRHATRDTIVAFQEARLRRLVSEAYASVPRYRTLFARHGLQPRDVQTLAHLPRIPMTSRRDLQASPPEDVVARGLDPARLLSQVTSGSSGVPLAIRRTWPEERLASAFLMRALRDFGVHPWHRRAYVVLSVGHDPRDWNAPQRVIRALGFYRKTSIDCRLPTPEILEGLRAWRPDVIAGYPGVLARLGRAHGLRPRLVITGGEVLTPLQRQQITDNFGTVVRELYATHELGLIAWQCPEGMALHVADDNVIMEVLRDDGRPAEPGETGEVVITRLHTFAMPFIRYRLGDIVTRGDTSCPCGAPFSTVLTVQGRMLDYFPLAGGRLFHPYELVAVVRGHAARWIGQFQIAQERADRVVALVAPQASPTPAELEAFERAARVCLGPGIEFHVRLLAHDVPLEPNGKFRLARSYVESAYDGIDWAQRRADDLGAHRKALKPERTRRSPADDAQG
jgi:phenylacetate-CoA ligase